MILCKKKVVLTLMKSTPPAADSVSEQITCFLASVEDYGMTLRSVADETELDSSNLSKAARGLRPVSRTEIDAICEFMGWELK